MQPLPLSSDGQRLSNNLLTAADNSTQHTDEKVYVADVAAGLYAAYERLRNAAEYTEQHLLLRAAIERFLRRAILFRGSTAKVGHELVVELTESGYLKNNSIELATVQRIDEFIEQYVGLAKTIHTTHRVSHDKARQWTVQVLSVCIEKLLVPHAATDAFVDFAYKHFNSSIDRGSFHDVSDQLFEHVLYIALHRALLKSDIATVRFYMMTLNSKKDQTTLGFVAMCKTVDEQFRSPLTNRMTRLISRYGAPMRILREVVTSETAPVEAIAHRPSFLAKIRTMAEQQYDLTHKRLVKGVVRAIIFIFITKMIIGLAIEVPYDLLVFGAVVPLPIVVNLLFPPLYMATAGWSISKPSQQNTEAIVGHIDKMLYQTDKPAIHYRVLQRLDSRSLSTVFNVIYGLAFILSFGLVVLLLHWLEFTVLHGVIFFIFFSAVSFLRFRLIQSARDLELVDSRQSLVATLAEFFYTPFIRLGMWLSDQYRQVNIITILLDFAIELPLKTSLHLLRQWTSFMRDKREEM